MCLSQLSRTWGTGSETERYRTTRISAVTTWDSGSRENQYRATREKYGSGRTREIHVVCSLLCDKQSSDLHMAWLDIEIWYFFPLIDIIKLHKIILATQPNSNHKKYCHDTISRQGLWLQIVIYKCCVLYRLAGELSLCVCTLVLLTHRASWVSKSRRQAKLLNCNFRTTAP